ncbi:MAG TPA: DUF3048 domain-containing protein [Candidatus Saccharimonadales bacterium]|nr:DUF3048 domain-containing protein [Candidatus Saccharimonadales bacterium]
MDSDFQPRRRPAKPLQTADDQTETFQTPEVVAAQDELQHAADGDQSAPADDELPGINLSRRGKPPKKRRFLRRLHWPRTKKGWAALIIIILLLAGGGVFAWRHFHSKPATLKPIPKVTNKSDTVPSTLTGLPVDPSVNQRTVTGVMIENSTDARPQSGLGQAGVVFEAVAEGGVTRFLALYQDTAPDNLGPVRSARPYYVQWNLGFDAGYAHVGGSPDALNDIKAWHVRDLDQFSNAGAYHRISSRAAPHNVYTSIAALNQLEVDKGYTTSHYTGFARKAKAGPAKQPPTARTIDLTLSGPTYNAHYDYNAKTNTYARSEGGAPQIDANTGKQISPTVVIALVMPYSLGALDSSGAYYSQYGTIGSGTAYIFQDGGVTTGQWTKTSMTSQFTFTDSSGKTIKLDPGYTWLTAVSGTDRVSYAP